MPISTIRSRLYDARIALRRNLAGSELTEDMGGRLMEAQRGDPMCPAVRVCDGEAAATHVSLQEEPFLFLRLLPDATSEMVQFQYARERKPASTMSAGST